MIFVCFSYLFIIYKVDFWLIFFCVVWEVWNVRIGGVSSGYGGGVECDFNCGNMVWRRNYSYKCWFKCSELIYKCKIYVYCIKCNIRSCLFWSYDIIILFYFVWNNYYEWGRRRKFREYDVDVVRNWFFGDWLGLKGFCSKCFEKCCVW